MKNYKKSLRLLTPLLLGEREGKRSLCSCSCCAESKVFQSLSALLMRKKSFSLKLVTLLPFPVFPSLILGWNIVEQGVVRGRIWMSVQKNVCVGRELPERDFPSKFLFLYLMNKLRRDRKLRESGETPHDSCPEALIHILASSFSQ